MAKRLFDLFLAAIGLGLLFPLFIVVAIWIKRDSSGSVFFRQLRVGRHGRLFLIHKFRTMTVGAAAAGRLTVGNDVRVTSSGAFLRKYKIDELPQLIDVLLGHMSLVGPRPEVPEFMDCYPPDIRQKVLSVRPGITDRASIQMVDENELLAAYPDPRKAYIEVILPIKQRYYLEYVDSHGLRTDIGIILQTLKKIIVR